VRGLAGIWELGAVVPFAPRPQAWTVACRYDGATHVEMRVYESALVREALSCNGAHSSLR